MTFKNIWGTSATITAVNLICSGDVPCQNIILDDIYLTFNGPEGPANTSCLNVKGHSYGTQVPPACL